MLITPQRAPVHEGLNYAGDILPVNVWEQLKIAPNSVLIDVRTPPEWAFSGEPDLSGIGKNVIKISWRFFSPPVLNDQFSATVKALGILPNDPIFFICRSGGRSREAAHALTQEGFTQCYNVAEGFEGPPDNTKQRGHIAGWKASGLPWRQD